MAESKKRCGWVRTGDKLSERYHDTEWGVPVSDDRILFEFLILESAQAGLSWDTILKKRAAYREAFAHFDPKKVARFNKRDINRLMKESGIVRHRLKIEAAVKSAGLFLDIQKEFGSFATYLAPFSPKPSERIARQSLADIPALTVQSEALAKDLKSRGFKFFGPVIAYAYMQAVGLVNDHTTDCFRFQEVKKKNRH